MDANTPLWKAHDISQQLQDKIEVLPNVGRAFVHVDHETTHIPVSAMIFVTISSKLNHHRNIESMFDRFTNYHDNPDETRLTAPLRDTMLECFVILVPYIHGSVCNGIIFRRWSDSISQAI